MLTDDAAATFGNETVPVVAVHSPLPTFPAILLRNGLLANKKLIHSAMGSLMRDQARKEGEGRGETNMLSLLLAGAECFWIK
jgi:hypothetical protein